MQQTLEDLRGQIVAHEQAYHARVTTFRALLLKEASVQFKEDAAIVKSRTQSVYGSIYALRRASSVQSSPSHFNKGRLHETSTTASSPVGAMQLPTFNSDVAEHELSFTVRSSPRSMRKGRHNEASSPVVALRKERRQSHMSHKDRQADGESDGWAVRSTKSIRILLDEDVEPTSTHTHVQPLGGEASPSPSTAAKACGESESPPLRHDSPRVARILSDMTVTDVGDDDDDHVVLELTSATHDSPTLHQQPPQPPHAESTDCVPRQAIALPTEHNLLMLRDDVTTSQQQARSDAPQYVAGASAMKYVVVDYDDIQDFLRGNNFTAQDDNKSTAYHHSVSMMDIPIDAQYVDIDHLVEDTDQSRCDPRYVPAYDADASPLQAPQPPPLTQGCTHTPTAHDPPQKFPSEGDFDALVETANASTLFANNRRNDLSVCDIEDEDVELLDASSSAFGPTYKSAAAWGDDDVQQAASPHSSMSTNSVRPPPRTSILVSRDHGAVGSPKKRHSGGGSEIDLEWSMSATPVESPSHAMRSVKKKPDTSTNTMILRDILFDLQTAYSTLPHIPPQPTSYADGRTQVSTPLRADTMHTVGAALRLEHHVEHIMHLENQAMRLLLALKTEKDQSTDNKKDSLKNY